MNDFERKLRGLPPKSAAKPTPRRVMNCKNHGHFYPIPACQKCVREFIDGNAELRKSLEGVPEQLRLLAEENEKLQRQVNDLIAENENYRAKL